MFWIWKRKTVWTNANPVNYLKLLIDWLIGEGKRPQISWVWLFIHLQVDLNYLTNLTHVTLFEESEEIIIIYHGSESKSKEWSWRQPWGQWGWWCRRRWGWSCPQSTQWQPTRTKWNGFIVSLNGQFKSRLQHHYKILESQQYSDYSIMHSISQIFALDTCIIICISTNRKTGRRIIHIFIGISNLTGPGFAFWPCFYVTIHDTRYSMPIIWLVCCVWWLYIICSVFPYKIWFYACNFFIPND